MLQQGTSLSEKKNTDERGDVGLGVPQGHGFVQNSSAHPSD